MVDMMGLMDRIYASTFRRHPSFPKLGRDSNQQAALAALAASPPIPAASIAIAIAKTHHSASDFTYYSKGINDLACYQVDSVLYFWYLMGSAKNMEVSLIAAWFRRFQFYSLVLVDIMSEIW